MMNRPAMHNPTMNRQSPAIVDPLALWAPVMDYWLDAMMSASRMGVNLWLRPFNPPLEDEREVEGDLDIPGPLEREFEHNLHA